MASYLPLCGAGNGPQSCVQVRTHGTAEEFLLGKGLGSGEFQKGHLIAFLPPWIVFYIY